MHLNKSKLLIFIITLLSSSQAKLLCDEDYYQGAEGMTLDDCYGFYYGVAYFGQQGDESVFSLRNQGLYDQTDKTIYYDLSNGAKNYVTDFHVDNIYWFETFTKKLHQNAHFANEGMKSLKVMMRLFVLATLFPIKWSNKANHALLWAQAQDKNLNYLLDTNDWVFPLSTLFMKGDRVHFVFNDDYTNLAFYELFNFYDEENSILHPTVQFQNYYSKVKYDKTNITIETTQITNKNSDFKAKNCPNLNIENIVLDYYYLGLLPEYNQESERLKYHKMGEIRAPFGGYLNCVLDQQQKEKCVQNFVGEDFNGSMNFSNNVDIITENQAAEVVSVGFQNVLNGATDLRGNNYSSKPKITPSGTTTWSELSNELKKHGINMESGGLGTKAVKIDMNEQQLYDTFKAADFIVYALQNYNDEVLENIKHEFWGLLMGETRYYRITKLYNILQYLTEDQSIFNLFNIPDYDNMTDEAIGDRPMTIPQLLNDKKIKSYNQIVLQGVCTEGENGISSFCSNIIKESMHIMYLTLKEKHANTHLKANVFPDPFQFDTICINDDNSGKIDYDGLYIPNFILDNNAKDSHKNKGIQTAITSIKKSISSIQKHLKAQNDAVYLPNYFYQLILSAQLNALRWFRNHFTLNLGSVNEMAVAMQKKKGFHFPDFYNDGSIGHMFAFNTVYLYKDSDKVEFLREYNPCWTNLPHEDSFRRLVV